MTEFGGLPATFPSHCQLHTATAAAPTSSPSPGGQEGTSHGGGRKHSPSQGSFLPQPQAFLQPVSPQKMWLGYSVQGQKGPKAYTPEKEIGCLRQQETFVPVALQLQAQDAAILTSGCRTTLTLCNRHQSPSLP